MDGAIWGFVGVVVGGLITVGAEIVRARNEASLDSDKRRDDRAVERERLQRDTLVELLSALTELARVTVRISDARVSASAAAGRWVSIEDQYMTGEVREANAVVQLRVGALSSIVLDDEVRALCSKATLASIFVAQANTREAAEAALVEHVTTVADASKRCGAVIRELLIASTSR